MLIYFNLETKREVLRRVRSAIRPKAFLLLGAAETTWGLDDAWERVPVERGSTYQLSSRRAA